MTDDRYSTRQTLIIRARNRDDADAWDEFVSTYRLFICHVLNRMNVGENDFEDLLQEVMLRLWEKLGSYDPDKGKFRSWLSYVVRNIVLNFVQKNKTRIHKLEQFSLEVKDGSAFHSGVDRMIEREWKLHISGMAMDSIRSLFSETAIAVFELSLEGLDRMQISKRLQITPDSVKVLKSRVKSRYLMEVKRLINELETC